MKTVVRASHGPDLLSSLIETLSIKRVRQPSWVIEHILTNYPLLFVPSHFFLVSTQKNTHDIRNKPTTFR